MFRHIKEIIKSARLFNEMLARVEVEVSIREKNPPPNRWPDLVRFMDTIHAANRKGGRTACGLRSSDLTPTVGAQVNCAPCKREAKGKAW